MALIKNLFWVIVAAVLGYSIYLFLPVITTRTEISQEARGKVEYISRGMRGKKLNVAVVDKLQTISVPGELNVESVQAVNNAGRLTLSFDYTQYVSVKLPNGQEKVIARFPHHILIEDLPLRGQ